MTTMCCSSAFVAGSRETRGPYRTAVSLASYGVDNCQVNSFYSVHPACVCITVSGVLLTVGTPGIVWLAAIG